MKVADLKTDIDMTNVRYIKQTEEHKNFRKEIKHLRTQLKEWTEIKHSVSPRPEWKRLQEYVPGISTMRARIEYRCHLSLRAFPSIVIMSCSQRQALKDISARRG